jgi:hypothetical protein
MAEDKTQNTEIESELYATTHTIINLSERYQEGDVKESYFQKSVKKIMNDLLKIHIKLKEQNLLLSDLLERTNLTKKYYQALDIINKVSSLNFADVSSQDSSKYSEKTSSSVLELPGITSKITASFITILDVFKLEAFEDINLLNKFFDELILNIRKFPGLERLEIKINKIREYLLKNKNRFLNNKNFRTLMEEDLYTLFKEFQNTLSIQT